MCTLPLPLSFASSLLDPLHSILNSILFVPLLHPPPTVGQECVFALRRRRAAHRCSMLTPALVSRQSDPFLFAAVVRRCTKNPNKMTPTQTLTSSCKASRALKLYIGSQPGTAARRTARSRPAMWAGGLQCSCVHACRSAFADAFMPTTGRCSSDIDLQKTYASCAFCTAPDTRFLIERESKQISGEILKQLFAGFLFSWRCSS